jgi:hypothetical protein
MDSSCFRHTGLYKAWKFVDIALRSGIPTFGAGQVQRLRHFPHRIRDCSDFVTAFPGEVAFSQKSPTLWCVTFPQTNFRNSPGL